MNSMIKIPPEKLPAPRLEPTRPAKINHVVVKTFAEEKQRRQQIKWTDAKDAVVIEMLRNGEKHKTIADQLGVSKSAVNKRVQRLRRKGADI